MTVELDTTAASAWLVRCGFEHGFGGAADAPDTAVRRGLSVAFDGELYDRRPLAQELELNGEASSADIVLAAYERWGKDALNRLDGVYAWVMWDGRTKQVRAARDALGLHPLFYARVDGALLFSPALERLVERADVGTELNRVAIADHICGRWPDPGETYYARVRRVPPGHMLEADALDTRVERYWFPVASDGPVRWIEADELERFDELMGRAVGRALEHGRPGIFLSGGLDSVSVAALAADITRRQNRPEPLALSLVFPREADEEHVQRTVAQQLGLEQVLLPFREAAGGPILRRALDVVATWPTPFANAWHSAYRALTAEGKQRGVRVILTGGGGDEWLTVTPLLAADLLRRGDVPGLFRLWRTMTRSFPVRPGTTARNLLWSYGAKPIVADAASRVAPRALARYRRRTKLRLTPPWVAPDPAIRSEMLRRAYESSLPSPSHGFYLREGQLSLDHALVSMEMEDFYEAGRRSGVPIRMPFWDRDVVDFLYRTPPDALNEDGRSKGLVRGMLQRRFPEVGFERQKKVLATNYFSQVVKEDGPELWREMGGAQVLSEVGIVDKVHLESFTRAAFAAQGTPRDVARVWIVMTLEHWARSRLNRGGR